MATVFLTADPLIMNLKAPNPQKARVSIGTRTRSQPIFTKFGEFVDLTDVITPTKFGYKIFIGYSRPRGGKSDIPYRKQTAYITVPCATALACDDHLSSSKLNNLGQ